MSVEGLTLAASPCPSDEPDCSRIQTTMGNPTVPSTSIHLCDVATALVLDSETSYLVVFPNHEDKEMWHSGKSALP